MCIIYAYTLKFRIFCSKLACTTDSPNNIHIYDNWNEYTRIYTTHKYSDTYIYKFKNRLENNSYSKLFIMIHIARSRFIDLYFKC